MSDRLGVPIAGQVSAPPPCMARVRHTFDSIRRLGLLGVSVSKLPARDGRAESEALRDFDLETMVTGASYTRWAPKVRDEMEA